jgi:acetoin utilization protein AcuB
MVVGMWMTRDPVTVPPAMPIAEAAQVMARHRIRRLLVVQPGAGGPALAGLVSLSDVARAFPPDVNPLSAAAAERGPRQPVSSIMARQPHIVEPDTPLEEAARLLMTRKVGALPVVRAGHPVGIITESDIFRALVEVVGGGGAPGVRVTFALSGAETAADVAGELARGHGVRVATALTIEREGQRLGMARLTGSSAQAVVDDLWKSGRRVLTVTRT